MLFNYTVSPNFTFAVILPDNTCNYLPDGKTAARTGSWGDQFGQVILHLPGHIPYSADVHRNMSTCWVAVQTSNSTGPTFICSTHVPCYL